MMELIDQRWQGHIRTDYMWDSTPGDEGWRPVTNHLFAGCSTGYVSGGTVGDPEDRAVMQCYEISGLLKMEMEASPFVDVLGEADGYPDWWQTNAEDQDA